MLASKPIAILGCALLFAGMSGPGMVSADTRSEHNAVKRQIEKLDARLDREERKARAASSEVRSLEKKLGRLEQRIYSVEKKITETGKHLQETIKEREALDDQLEEQKRGLVQQIQALYTAGKQSPIRLLLKQDDPSDIGRMIKYFDYMNTSRVKKIQSIKQTYEKKKKAEADIENDQKELIALNADLKKQQEESSLTLKKRNAYYKKLKTSVSNKQRELTRLKRRELVLQRKIAELMNNQTPPESTKRGKDVKTGEKTKTATANKQKTQVSSSAKRVTSKKFTPNKRFSTLRGKLAWPVSGKLIHKYGRKRNEKQRWKGVVLAAPGGRKVKAVADGKVEFAGWFNGYGYLVIIRHDNRYRSLYGYNRSVYVREGQIVKAGETIAAVGNSGGQQKEALYFEIRKGTVTQNPSHWCR